MTTEELNALIMQAEGGDVSAMNQLTHIYGRKKEYVAALKWYRILIQIDNNPQLREYHNTNYNRLVCEKIIGVLEKAISISDAENLLNKEGESISNKGIFPNEVFFVSAQAKNDIRIIRKIWDEADKKDRKERKQLDQINTEIARIEKGYSYSEIWDLLTFGGKFTSPIRSNPNNHRLFVIPNGVKRIGSYFFFRCHSLSTVTFPDSVTSIGVRCFEGCRSLKKIIVPKGTKQRFAQMKGLKGLEDKIVEE